MEPSLQYKLCRIDWGMDMSINYIFMLYFTYLEEVLFFYGLPPCQAPKEIGLLKKNSIERERRRR